jgi:hypothetical protein
VSTLKLHYKLKSTDESSRLVACDVCGLSSFLEQRDLQGEHNKTVRSVGSYSQRHIPEGLHLQQGRSKSLKLVMPADAVQAINHRLLENKYNVYTKFNFFKTDDLPIQAILVGTTEL